MAVTLTLPFLRVVRTRARGHSLRIRVDLDVALPSLAPGDMPLAYLSPAGWPVWERDGIAYQTAGGLTRGGTAEELHARMEAMIRAGTGTRNGEVRLPAAAAMLDDGLEGLEHDRRGVEETYLFRGGVLLERRGAPRLSLLVGHDGAVRVGTSETLRRSAVLLDEADVSWLGHAPTRIDEAEAAAAALSAALAEAGMTAARARHDGGDEVSAWEVVDAGAAARVEAARPVSSALDEADAMLRLSDEVEGTLPPEARLAQAALIVRMAEEAEDLPQATSLLAEAMRGLRPEGKGHARALAAALAYGIRERMREAKA